MVGELDERRCREQNPPMRRLFGCGWTLGRRRRLAPVWPTYARLLKRPEHGNWPAEARQEIAQATSMAGKRGPVDQFQGRPRIEPTVIESATGNGSLQPGVLRPQESLNILDAGETALGDDRNAGFTGKRRRGLEV